MMCRVMCKAPLYKPAKDKIQIKILYYHQGILMIIGPEGKSSLFKYS